MTMLTRLVRRRSQPLQASYRPRRVDVEPFEHGRVDWRRMLMSMQRLS
jgi:hypothetical protein